MPFKGTDNIQIDLAGDDHSNLSLIRSAMVEVASSMPMEKDDSASRQVILTPSNPQGVMARNGGSDSRVMLIAKPCIEIHFRTPTPMEASLRFSTHTPVIPSRRPAETPRSAQAAISASSIRRRWRCRSRPRGLRSRIG